MKKIWQKSLASMVSAALCLTAFVGCLTVNAATTIYEGTITSKGATVTTDDAQATVTLTLSSENAMNAAAIKVSTEYGKLASVNVGDYPEDNYKIEEGYVVLDTGKLLIEAIGNEKGFTTADVVLTFNKAENVGAGTYPVTVSAFAGETAATWNEDIVNLAVTGEINITVNAATTKPVVDPAFDTAFRYILNIQQTVGVNMVFTLPSAYDDFVIKINRNTFNSQYQYVAKEVVFKPADAYLVSGSSYGFLYNDIGIYELSIDATITVEGYKDGVLTGISNAINYNLADLIATTINENRAGRFESLYSEVLWLADAALTYFQGIVDADIDNLVSPARNISTTPISDYTKYNDETSYTNNGVSFYMLRLVIQSSPSLQFIMNGITDDIRADASFTSTHTSNVLGVVNIEAPLSKTSDNMMIAGQANAYLHNTIALYDTDKIMNVKVVDSTGKVLASVDTSMAMQLCATLDKGVSNANLKALYERVLIFGETARSIFE